MALAVAVLTAACSPGEQRPPAERAIAAPAATSSQLTVRTDIAGAELFVDGRPSGPLTDGQNVELAPGDHVLEARRGGVIIARATPFTSAGVFAETRLSEPVVRAEAAPTAPSEEPAPVSPEEARACMMAGDNRCVIQLLEGHELNEPQQAALIEAYRARSQQAQALEHMRTYVERYPDRPRARQYEQLLSRHGG